MEALAALSLASNVVQFVVFVSDLISTSAEISRSTQGASRQTLELKRVFGSLSDFDCRLRYGEDSRRENDRAPGLRELLVNHKDLQPCVELQSHIQPLEGLATECVALCGELLVTVQRLEMKERRCRPFQSFIAALRTTWNSRTIRDLEERIGRY